MIPTTKTKQRQLEMYWLKKQIITWPIQWYPAKRAVFHPLSKIRKD